MSWSLEEALPWYEAALCSPKCFASEVVLWLPMHQLSVADKLLVKRK